MSFSLELAPLWQGANVLIAGISPAYMALIGISLGLALLGVIVRVLDWLR